MNNNNNYNNDNKPLQTVNPLLRQIPAASLFTLFLLLIWRSLAAYELASQFSTDSFLRIFTLTPSLTILVCNLLGFIITAFRPHNFKNYLKVLLAINMVREFMELFYNLVKIILSSSTSFIPREVYVGRLFHCHYYQHYY